MNSNRQKFIASILMFILIGNTFFGILLYKPKKANAIDPLSVWAIVSTVAKVIGTAYNIYTDVTTDCVGEDCKTEIGEFLSKHKILKDTVSALGNAAWVYARVKILDNIVTDFIVQIQGHGRGGKAGAQGQFVSDYNLFETDAKNAALESFLADLNVTNFCQTVEIPFAEDGLDIRTNLAQFLGKKPQTFGIDTQCPMEKKIGNMRAYQENLKKFFRGESFDWDTWLNVIQPEGNMYGVYLTALGQQTALVEDNVQREKSKLEAAGGWLGLEECSKWVSSTNGMSILIGQGGTIEDIIIKLGTPGSAAYTFFSGALEHCGAKWQDESCLLLEPKSPVECVSKLADVNAECLMQKYDGFTCAQYRTLTPGTEVARLTSKYLGLKADSLVASDLKNYTDAIMIAFINRIFEEGKGLLGYGPVQDKASCINYCEKQLGKLDDNKPCKECKNNCYVQYGNYTQDNKEKQQARRNCDAQCDASYVYSDQQGLGCDGRNLKRTECDAKCTNDWEYEPDKWTAGLAEDESVRKLAEYEEQEAKAIKDEQAALQRYYEESAITDWGEEQILNKLNTVLNYKRGLLLIQQKVANFQYTGLADRGLEILAGAFRCEAKKPVEIGTTEQRKCIWNKTVNYLNGKSNDKASFDDDKETAIKNCQIATGKECNALEMRLPYLLQILYQDMTSTNRYGFTMQKEGINMPFGVSLIDTMIKPCGYQNALLNKFSDFYWTTVHSTLTDVQGLQGEVYALANDKNILTGSIEYVAGKELSTNERIKRSEDKLVEIELKFSDDYIKQLKQELNSTEKEYKATFGDPAEYLNELRVFTDAICEGKSPEELEEQEKIKAIIKAFEQGFDIAPDLTDELIRYWIDISEKEFPEYKVKSAEELYINMGYTLKAAFEIIFQLKQPSGLPTTTLQYWQKKVGITPPPAAPKLPLEEPQLTATQIQSKIDALVALADAGKTSIPADKPDLCADYSECKTECLSSPADQIECALAYWENRL